MSARTLQLSWAVNIGVVHVTHAMSMTSKHACAFELLMSMQHNAIGKTSAQAYAEKKKQAYADLLRPTMQAW
jgi:hypothetical protein